MCGDGCSWRCSCGGVNAPIASTPRVMRDFTAPRGYTVLTADDLAPPYRCLSFAESKNVARPISQLAAAVVERDASPDGNEGEQTCARFVNGQQVFPF